MARRGKVVIPAGVNVWPHELRTAQALADAGHDVTFVRRSEEFRAKSADVLIDGLLWEMKSPKSSGMKAVERNVRKAVSQSPRVVLDSRRMRGIPDHAIERELRVCAAGRVRGLLRLLFVNRKGEVAQIK